MNTSIKQTVVITNQLGLHLRAAAEFIKLANMFKSDITVEKDGKKANGKSIMSLVSLAAPFGTSITITTLGTDSKKALDSLVELVKNKFGEKN